MDIMRDSLAARIDEDMPGGTVRSLAANCFRDRFLCANIHDAKGVSRE